jgi:hypothetical protein
MPPQKNKGKKGVAGRESGCSKKNMQFIKNFISDVREEGEVSDVHIARVMKMLGNGRVELFYVLPDGRGILAKALIRGLFRGKGKRDAWIEIGSIVAVDIQNLGDNTVVAVLSRADVHLLEKEMELDPRILAMETTNTDDLVKNTVELQDAFEFTDDDISKL